MYFVALFVLFPAEEKNFKVWGQFFPVIAITKNEPREQFCRPRPKAEAGNGSRGSFFCDQDNWKKLSETWKFIYEAVWNRKKTMQQSAFLQFSVNNDRKIFLLLKIVDCYFFRFFNIKKVWNKILDNFIVVQQKQGKCRK